MRPIVKDGEWVAFYYPFPEDLQFYKTGGLYSFGKKIANFRLNPEKTFKRTGIVWKHSEDGMWLRSMERSSSEHCYLLRLILLKRIMGRWQDQKPVPQEWIDEYALLSER